MALTNFRVINTRYNLVGAGTNDNIVRNLDQCQVDNFLAYQANPGTVERANCLRVGISDAILQLEWQVEKVK